MLFFEKHFTKHHFFYAPHRWFLAFLLSPIHILEKRYQKKYHLQFAHARKLFFFDVFLVIGMIALASLTAAWFRYNPTIVDQIDLTISESDGSVATSPATARVKSGELVTYQINFKNNSAATLARAHLEIRLPVGFLVTEIISPYLYDEADHTFHFPNLEAGASGTIKIKGWLYGVPHQEEYLLAELGFKQEGREVEEIKSVALINILRGSVLSGVLEMPDKIINREPHPAKLILKNDGGRVLTGVQIPLILPNAKIINPLAETGSLDNDSWKLESLNPGETATLSFTFTTDLNNDDKYADFVVTPLVDYKGNLLAQAEIVKKLRLIHPEIKILSRWQNDRANAAPGEVVVLSMTLSNTGDTALYEISLILPIDVGIVDTQKIAGLNNGIYRKGIGGAIGNVFIVDNSVDPKLAELKPGQSISIDARIPLRAPVTAGTNIAYTIEPRAEASPADMPETKIVFKNKSPILKIGTTLSILAEARYYTEDGDQLGRGPLPPQVGKETKYGMILRVANSTSGAEKINLTATLPTAIRWTGKTSVGQGSNIKYNPENNSISWSLNSLSAHDSVLLFFEVGLTPTESERGSTPVLLENIRVSGIDSFIGRNLNASAPTVTASLDNDAEGREKGTLVR
ncbi:MAG: hypothetical protein AAB390_02165 [Patescibacteria group bacterium]|mgnify:CR=1 FL=1